MLVLVVGASVTYANWPGSVTNTANSTKTGSMAWSIGPANGTCTLPIRASAPTTNPCTNSILGRGAAQTVISGGTTSSISFTNNGDLTSSQVSASMSIPSCGVVKFANAVDAANPMTVRANPTFNTVDKWGTTSSVRIPTFGQGAGVVQEGTPVGLAGGFSFGLWFKVGTTLPAASVGLMGLTISAYNAQSTGTTVSPLGLWIDTTGHLRFQVAGLVGAVVTAATANTYLDGAWHFAVVTASTVLLNTTVTAWVDNTAAANTASITTLNTTLLSSGQGYWHVGFVDSKGATNPNRPSSNNMAGNASGAFVRNTATSAAEFTALRASATAASYKASVQGLSSIDSLWMMDDDGRSTWEGQVPGLGGVLPCDMVTANWTFANPAASIGTASTTLRGIIGTFDIGVPAPGATQTSSQFLQRNTSYNASASRLLLFLPITYTLKSLPGPGWTVPWTWMSTGPTGTTGAGLQLS